MSDELVTIGTFASEAEAQLVRGQLAEAGVAAFVSAGGLLGMGLSSESRVLVAASDARRAIALLNEAEDDAAAPAGPRSEQVTETPPRPAGITDEAPDDDDPGPPLTLREQMAVRAFKAALLGVIPLIWPLQLYVSWLLLKVYVSDEPLGDGPRGRAWAALAINLPLVLLLAIFARSLWD